MKCNVSLKENKVSKPFMDLYLSMRSEIWRRCQNIAECYYDAKLWTKGINYITNFDIEDDKIIIYEGAHGMDLEFELEDFFDNEKLESSIIEDINNCLMEE